MVVGRGGGVGQWDAAPGFLVPVDQLFFREASWFSGQLSALNPAVPLPSSPACGLRFQFTFVTWEGQWLSRGSPGPGHT